VCEVGLRHASPLAPTPQMDAERKLIGAHRANLAIPLPYADQIMTIRPIVRYPDPRLALPAQPVTAFDDALRELARDLLETMHAASGIGITAPHIGVSLRLVVLDLDATGGARTYVNPAIIWASSETILHREGSVSMPGVNDDIERHARVRISYQDVHGNCRPRNRTACAPSATSTRSISSTACSGSGGCPA
jgi:peptide deformylase